jgi:cell division protein FtsB
VRRFFKRLVVWFLAAAVISVVLAFAVFPTRTFLDQRHQLASAEERIRLLDAENKRLESRVQKLHTDSEVERLAREQYSLVRPGEEAYAVLPAPGDPPALVENPRVPAPHRDQRSVWQRVKDLVTFWS